MDQELLMLIGRMEGKLDTLVTLQTAQNERISVLETRTGAVETRVTVLEASETSNKSRWATIGAAGVAVMSALASLFGGYFNPH